MVCDDLAGFPTGDSAALRAQLDRLLSLPADDRRAIRLAARSAVLERWSWASIARRLLELSIA